VSTDPLANKRQMALDMGADAVVEATSDDLAGSVRGELGESADVVFDWVSNQATLESAVKMAIKGRSVAAVGGADRLVTSSFPLPKEAEAFAAISSGREAKILVVADPQ